MQRNGREKRDIIVIGGSAGALEAVLAITRSLPAGLQASIFIVLHTAPRQRNLLTDVLNQNGALPAYQAREGEPIVPGRIYVPAPDRHLILAKDHIHLSRGPKEGLHRPSINMTFRSAARTYGDAVAGVLLSGLLDDGASGLWEIAHNGGVSIVQDPEEAEFPSMPLNALRDVPIDYRARAREIGPLLSNLASGASMAFHARSLVVSQGREKFSGFSCPECRGPLWESQNGPMEFRCRVGHTFSLKSLIDEHTSAQERKLYEAIVALEEGAALAEHAIEHIEEERREGLRREAEQLRQHAAAVRQLLDSRNAPALD
jgi:two-component system chemotaxis response regulator CheB